MNKITIKLFRERHPEDVSSITNQAYTRVANGVLEVLRKTKYWTEHDETELVELAIILTHYFEDVVSEVGLWRSFVEMHQAMYGKPLPFFDIAGEYDPDRLHVEDIQLLMWNYIISDEDRGAIPNPCNPDRAVAAKSVYDYLEGLFEDTPINEALYDYFHEAKFAKSFYEVRELFAWYFIDCYLTNGRFCRKIINEETQDILKFADDPDDIDLLSLSTTAVGNASTRLLIGPLALLTKDWLAALMRIHGQTALAADIEAIDARDLMPYRLEQYDRRFVTLRTPDDELIRVERTRYFEVSESLLRSPNTTGCIGSFASYRGEWFLNGLSSWGSYAQNVEKCKEYKQALANTGLPNYDKYAAKTADKGKDGLMLFFKTPADYNHFIKDELRLSGDNMPLINGRDSVVLFVPKRIGTGFYAIQDNVSSIKSPDNPMYDPAEARKAGLFVANIGGLPGDFCRYIISHNLIPDAAFNSVDGYESGRRLLQDNLDFVARALRRNFY